MSFPFILAVVLVAVCAAAAVVAGVVVSRRRSSPPAAPPVPTSPARIRPTDVPMTGLESALSAVTDREGRPIRDRIDAESGHVDELRVPDDTGPVLRRALDHVVHEPSPSDAEDPAPWLRPGAPAADRIDRIDRGDPGPDA